MSSVHTCREPSESEKWEKEPVKKWQKLTPTQHTSVFVHFVWNMRRSWVFPLKYFTASHRASGIPNSKFLVTTLLSPSPSSAVANTSTTVFVSQAAYSFQRCPPLCTCSHTEFKHLHTVAKDAHPQMWHLMVTLHLTNSCMHTYSTSPTQGAMLCVKRQDPDGSHLVCADGLLWWLRTGYAQPHTNTQMATHWEWPGDGHADYWFAQINDSQPGHLTIGEQHQQSWHGDLAHKAHIPRINAGFKSGFNLNSLLPKYIF